MELTTPQEIIYKALRNTGEDLPKTKPVKEKDLCCFCGNIEGENQRDLVFGSNFTNRDLFQNPDSLAVCDYCTSMMQGRIGTKQLRQASWIISPNKIRVIPREEILVALIDEIKELPFICYITTSFKKLGQIKVIENYSQDHFSLLFEEVPVFFSKDTAREILKTIELFYSIPKQEEEKKTPRSFFTKAEILTGQYKPQRIKEFGYQEFLELEKKIRSHRGSGLLQLLVHALNQEKLGRERREKIEKIRSEEPRPSRPLPKLNNKREDSEPNCLPSLEIDQLGQCVWW